MVRKHANELVFCRHGEHEEVDGLPSWQFPLTQVGIDQAKEVSDKYSATAVEKKAVSVRNIRSINTAEIVIGKNNTTNFKVCPVTGDSILENIEISDSLHYEDPFSEPVFGKALSRALAQESIPNFMLYESDQVGFKEDAKVSTLTTMARAAFELILRKSDENEDMLTFLVGREMYYFSLFARLRSFAYGPDSADDFLAKYTDVIAQQATPGIDIANIIAKKPMHSKAKKSLEFSDQFGEIVIQDDDILEFQQYISRPIQQRIGAYVLPRVLDSEGTYSYILLDYGKGLGFVGGGLRNGETLEKALKREVKEELGVNLKNDFGQYRKFAKPYRFLSNRGAEELHIAIADINQGVALDSKLKKAKTKTLTLTELLETRGLQEEVRAYLETNIEIITG